MYSIVRDGKRVWPYCTSCHRRLQWAHVVGSLILKHFDTYQCKYDFWVVREDYLNV